jgi:serine phosphatase RsbU (regulator of sigma subunit)
MLGAVPNAIFNSGTATLHPGCMLIACSDGVTECQNSRDEEFDLARLSAAAEPAEGRTASHTLFSALGAVLDFADGCPLSDDVTLLVVRREPVSLEQRSDARDSAALMQGRIAVASARAAGRQKLVS